MQLNDRYHPTAATMTLAENVDAGISYLAEGMQRCGAAGAQWFYVHGHCRGGGK